MNFRFSELDFETLKKAEDWQDLTNWKQRLYWQKTHKKDIKVIAKLASHILEKHKWCNDDCSNVVYPHENKQSTN